MVARVYVTLKPGVFDPAGNAVQRGLTSLGFKHVEGVRLGKYFEVTVAKNDADAVKAEVESMCQKLLANPVIESYRVEV